IIGATTSYGNIGQNITTGEMRYRAGFSGWGGIHTFYTDGAERFWITALGNVGINAPTGGVPLTLTTSPSQVSQAWVDGTGTAQVQQSSGHTYFGTSGAHDLRLMTSNTVRGAISAAGNWTINAPSSGL